MFGYEFLKKKLSLSLDELDVGDLDDEKIQEILNFIPKEIKENEKLSELAEKITSMIEDVNFTTVHGALMELLNDHNERFRIQDALSFIETFSDLLDDILDLIEKE
jgi:hypothetical protein